MTRPRPSYLSGVRLADDLLKVMGDVLRLRLAVQARTTTRLEAADDLRAVAERARDLADDLDPP